MAAAPDSGPDLLADDFAARELARRHLIDFVEYTKADYVHNWFGTELAEECETFLEAVVAGESPRTIIEAPPRHGKSEFVSRRLPAYAFGKYPWMQFVGASYGPDLAEAMSRDVKAIMDSDEYQAVFPETKLPAAGRPNAQGKKRTDKFWEILDQIGNYRARGVGQGLSGHGAHCLVIDDPFKDLDDARSEAYRARVMRWYRAVANTRIEPGGGILIMHTRWHKLDLVGQLLEDAKKGGAEFKVISYPAIATKKEKNRKKGEALVEHRYPVKQLKRIEIDVGPYVWSALYQQRPTVEGGSIFEDDWWHYWTPQTLPRILYRRIYADTAQKIKEANDYSVFQCWGYGVDDRIYLLDQIRGKWKAPKLLKKAVGFWDKWNIVGQDHESTEVMKIEDKSSGTGLIQQLEEGDGDAKGATGPVFVEPIQRHIDKIVRANSAAPRIKSGRVVIPSAAPWLLEYEAEFSDFTPEMSHAFDDQIDPTMDAIQDLLGPMRDMYAGVIT